MFKDVRLGFIYNFINIRISSFINYCCGKIFHIKPVLNLLMGFSYYAESSTTFQNPPNFFKYNPHIRNVMDNVCHVNKVKIIIRKRNTFMAAFQNCNIRFFVNCFLSHYIRRFNSVNLELAYAFARYWHNFRSHIRNLKSLLHL